MKNFNLRTLKYELLYIVVKVVRKLTCTFSRKFILKVYGKLGHLLFLVLKKEREKTIRHLKIAFGDVKSEEEIYQLAKNTWINLCKSLMEFIRSKNIKSIDDLTKYVEIKGIENLHNALQQGKGVVLISSHLGPFEMCLYIISLLKYKIASTGSPLKYHKLHELMVENRTRHGSTFFEREGSFRKLYAYLKEGNIIGFLIDQDSKKVPSTFINFFGRPCYTPYAPALIAIKSGAPIIATHCYRKEDDTLVFEAIHVHIKSHITGNLNHDITQVTQCIHDVTQQYVSRYPDQWVWMHKRWNTQKSDVEKSTSKKTYRPLRSA